jgi:hypothetical protein
MKKNPDKEFVRQLTEVKAKLPNYYGVLVRAKYPHISKNKIYNVVNEGVEDWCVLEALKDIVGIKKTEVA